MFLKINELFKNKFNDEQLKISQESVLKLISKGQEKSNDNDVRALKFINAINKFIEKYPVNLDTHNTPFFKKIIWNYWNILYMYFLQKSFCKPRCDKTLDEYINVSIRIIELSLFATHHNDKNIIDLIFNTSVDNKCFFMHFFKIKDNGNITNSNVKIEKDISNKNKVSVILNNRISYIPASRPTMPKIVEDNKIYWFERYFRLSNLEIYNVFEGNESGNIINGRNTNGTSGKRHQYNTHNSFEDIVFSNRTISKDHTQEVINEFISKEKQLKSIQFYKNNNLTEKSISSYEVVSPIKQFFINKAISSQISKNNMHLQSDYKLPEIELLGEFIHNIYRNKNNLNEGLILTSLFLGLDIKQLIVVFLGIDQNIVYKVNKSLMTIQIPEDIYANNINLEQDIVYKVSNTQAEILLPEFLIPICKKIRENLLFQTKNLSTESLDNFIISVYNNSAKVLKKLVYNFEKHIVVSIKSLHKYLIHYYNIIYKTNDLRLLYSFNLSKTDKARCAYVMQPKRFVYLENWIVEFYNILTRENSNIATYNLDKTEYMGSPRFIEAGVFKNFLSILDNLEVENKIDRANLQMIFIRYSLSLLLATRYFKESCNLYNFSETEKIITIQEKVKNLRSHKRVIPLTNRAIRYIKLFYELKDVYQFDGFVPIIMNEMKDGSIISKELNDDNILKFIFKIASKEDYLKIEKFIKLTSTNMGRHIFSTLSIKYSLESEYENAFLNHFLYAIVDQGIYSNFDNQLYFKSCVNFIETYIEKEYFPLYINLEKTNGQ